MNSYKHGNWYCKPASKEEAREIIERAVQSGADNPAKWTGDETAYQFYCYGVKNGLVLYGSEREWVVAIKYTIEQVREKFPLPGEKRQWNGEGLPPVDCDHEFSANGVHWEERTILFKDDISFLTASKKFPASRWHYKVNDLDLKFRPLRNERDRWVEAAQTYFNKERGEVCPSELALIGIYDALKSGDLKAPEVK